MMIFLIPHFVDPQIYSAVHVYQLTLMTSEGPGIYKR